MKQKPESIEGNWDLLYRDYPKVYDEFAQVKKTPHLNMAEKFKLQGKIIADLGSGTGDSTFEYARVAKEVIGIEIEKSMIEVANKRAEDEKVKNVRFIQGDACNIPLDDNSVDAVIGATLAPHDPMDFVKFDQEATRICKKGGIIIFLNIAPGWNGGELHDVIGDTDDWGFRADKALEEADYDYEEVNLDQEYGSLDKIIRTYGFIFGKITIDHLRKHNKTNIRWKIRIRVKKR